MRAVRKLYDWTLSLAQSPYALWALACVAFIESSFFPIPPDVLLIPLILAMPHKVWTIALITTVSSVAGGLFGYFIGYAFFESIGLSILEFYGKTGKFDEFAARYNELGAWAVLIAGVTPFPFKVITIASGMTGLNFWVFVLSSIVARALRFFVIAFLLWKFGAPIRDFIEKRLGLVSIAFVVIVLGGFVAVRFL